MLLHTLLENRPRLLQVLLNRAKETKQILDAFKSQDLPVIQNLVSEIKSPARNPELVPDRNLKVNYIV